MTQGTDASAGEKRGQKSWLCIRAWNRRHMQKESGEKDKTGHEQELWKEPEKTQT